MIHPYPGGAEGDLFLRLLHLFKRGESLLRGAGDYPASQKDFDLRVVEPSDGESFFHRIGDMGYRDEQGRLWLCSRKAHRFFTSETVLYTIPCEAIFNQHRDVYRSALVGVGEPPNQRPVLVVEPCTKITDSAALTAELRQLAKANLLTAVDTLSH